MGLYRADNAALSATTAVQPGQTISAGAGVATILIQLNVPDGMTIYITEVGCTADSVGTTASLLELATTDTASTMSTAHSTTTIKPLLNNQSNGSRLTMGTGATGFGTGANVITTNTTLRTLHKLYVPQTYVYTYPLGTYPVVGNGTAESFVQLRFVSPVATQKVYAWLVFDEE